jgi:hypothetical protein
MHERLGSLRHRELNQDRSPVFVETAALLGRQFQARERQRDAVALAAMGQSIEHLEANHLVRDADLGHLPQKLLARQRVEVSPPLRRRFRTAWVVNVDLLARDLDAKLDLYRIRHFRRGLKAGQTFDDERLYLVSERRHRFFLL